jgi:hypothetical protein
MPKWNHVLRIKDVWKNEEMPFRERRVTIVERIKKLPQWKGDDTDEPLYGIVDGLESDFDPDDPDSTKDFDYWWGEFYDWCDGERVWVETF